MVQDDRRFGTTALPAKMLSHIQAASVLHTYKGMRMAKNPFDLALYPLLLWQMKPRTIIEIGSFTGGSAIWFADQAVALGLDTQIYSFDINPVTDVTCRNVTFRGGDARRPQETFPLAWIRSLPRPLLVVEDSDHFYQTTKAVLDHFAPLMHLGEYIVIEDGEITPLGWAVKFDGGPLRAISDFLAENSARFEIDRRYCDRYGHNVTANTDGYLRCIAR